MNYLIELFCKLILKIGTRSFATCLSTKKPQGQYMKEKGNMQFIQQSLVEGRVARNTCRSVQAWSRVVRGYMSSKD